MDRVCAMCARSIDEHFKMQGIAGDKLFERKMGHPERRSSF